MYLKSIELSGFKSFAKKCELTFTSSIAGIVGPNGSGKSNTAEAFRFVLGEQSMKSMRGKRGPDLIWSGNERTPAANRARVALTFDNKQQLLNIDFDEVVIERIVYRDGANEYSINGSKVRLKDVSELLSSANIGASGHHIISQGEADRILGASEKERREIIEEALGLRNFQYKKIESEKKLEKTAENMQEVKILRREIAPHLTFLERQMKKLERSRELKKLITDAYVAYIAHEEAFIQEETNRLATARVQPTKELRELNEEVIKESVVSNHTDKSGSDALESIDIRMQDLAHERGALEHARGRIEGQIALVQQKDSPVEKKSVRSIPFEKVEEFLTDTKTALLQVHAMSDISRITAIVARVGSFLDQFRDTVPTAVTVAPELLSSLQQELEENKTALVTLTEEEMKLNARRKDVLLAFEQEKESERESQKRYFEIKERKRELERVLEDVEREEVAVGRARERLTAVSYKAQDMGVVLENRAVDVVHTREEQEESMREIERMEARLEESGFVDEDTVREYEDTKRRDAFLEKELIDLEHSKASLLEVIASLDGEISVRFNEGLAKINEEFQNFFAMLFDGGSATLKLVKKTKRNEDGVEEEDMETKEGIEIRVQLPRKKVATLDVLSGGERALTSIALIFAMSQVNPPPFIILDETDAALDEANSRKYAEMVKTLSKRSQLILITHNRQTMEAAGELYGVTMGNDGVSKLLSVKFDEALSVAK